MHDVETISSLVGREPVATLRRTLSKENPLHILTSSLQNVNTPDWQTSGQGATPNGVVRWSVRKQTLRGGKQEGVEVVIVDNGRLTIAVCPTRGMGVLWAKSGDVTLGWDSPVKEIVDPRHINLQSRGGIGWLEGFNEFVCRCGLEWSGAPGTDQFINNNGDPATMELTLHGRIANIPASEVEVAVDETTPCRIRVRGRVDEKMLFGPKLELRAEISTEPGSDSFRITDIITNRGGNPQEFQLLYHCNFGPPLLGADSKFVAAVERVTPINARAVEGLQSYDHYDGPTLGFVEQVYKMKPLVDAQGRALAMLMNSAADRAASISFSPAELPWLTLWKNTDALEEGYVTGIEPATSFPHNRRLERHRGRVPKLSAGASRKFELEFSVHADAASVKSAADRIATIQNGRPKLLDPEPEKFD